MKTCPKCAEEVQDAAVKCRYCGHEFSLLKRVDTSFRNIGFGTLIVIFGGAAWIASSMGTDNPKAVAVPTMQQAEAIVAEEDAVKATLRDPGSAMFKHVGSGCGYVNSKNGFGGMNGFVRYVVADGRTVIDGHRPKKFNRLWSSHCPVIRGS